MKPRPVSAPVSFWKALPVLIKAVLICAAASIVIGIFNGLSRKGEYIPQSQQGPPELSAPTTDPNRISLVQYEMVSTGMSYADVQKLLGKPGEELSSNDIGGIHTVMYQWKAGAMANMNVTFQSNKVVSKAQFGLK